MLDRQIRILPTFTGYKEGVICFETQCAPEEVADLTLYAFEHHGEAYSPLQSPGSLRLFHERVLLGQDMPSVLVLTRWHRYDALMAAAIFIEPSIVLNPRCTSLVNSLDLVDRLGPPAFGHIPLDHKELAYMLRHLTSPYAEGQVPVEKILEVITQAAQMLISFVTEGTLPPMEVPHPDYEVIQEQGPFVVVEAEEYVWDLLWAEGYLMGIWFGPDREVEVRRKSELVPHLDPDTCLEVLRQTDSQGTWQNTHGIIRGTRSKDKRPLIQVLESLVFS